MSKKILCIRHYRELLKEIVETLEKKHGEKGVYRFKASDLGNYEELKKKGFRKLCSHGVIRVVGKDRNSNIYEITYDIYCTVKEDGKTTCRVTRKTRRDVLNYLK